MKKKSSDSQIDSRKSKTISNGGTVIPKKSNSSNQDDLTSIAVQHMPSI